LIEGQIKKSFEAAEKRKQTKKTQEINKAGKQNSRGRGLAIENAAS